MTDKQTAKQDNDDPNVGAMYAGLSLLSMICSLTGFGFILIYYFGVP